ncbi:MAG: elongation factor G [Ruminococcaceae bacterium]|nr:elongation factor G [Oscillospiraceae bacterium]
MVRKKGGRPMAVIETKKIRNIALLGHGGCGKTSLAEAMIYICGGSDRLGKIADGNTVSDFDPEEIKRGFSLSASLLNTTWKDTKINIIDTPGYLDFVGEVKQGLRVADSAIIVVDGKAGIEIGTELAWNYADEAGLPRAFFINKFDDNEARFARVLDDLHVTFGKHICPLTIPMVKDGEVKGCIDLIDQSAHVFDANGRHSVEIIPEESMEAVEKYRDMLMEAVASTDEDLMMKYFEGEEITHMEAINAVHEGIIHGDIVPVFCGAAAKLWGVWTLLDKIAESFPRHTAKKVEMLENGDEIEITPEGEPSLFVFKTVADPFVGKMSYFKVMNGTVKRDLLMKNNTTGDSEKLAHIYIMNGKKQTEVDELACGDIGMVAKLTSTNTNDTLTWNKELKFAPIEYPNSYYVKAMVPLTAKDEGKISQSIMRMIEEDLTLEFENNSETKQMLISGQGDMHLAVLEAKLKSRFGVNIQYDEPKMAYREKITKKVDVEGKHKKQNGGSGQYGHVKIRFAPGEDDGLTFTVSVVGGTVPKNFYPAVEKGLQDSMAKGVAGFPLVKLAADLYDGSYHDVDSDEISFKTAASIAYKKCLELAAPVILEPVGDMDITVPESLVGDVMGDLNKRRGAVMGMDAAPKKGYTIVHATAPKAEIVDYPIALRAMTQGRGSFEYTVTGYDTVPANIAPKIIEKYKQA